MDHGVVLFAVAM